jgi:hypothetical protein
MIPVFYFRFKIEGERGYTSGFSGREADTREKAARLAEVRRAKLAESGKTVTVKFVRQG